MNKNFYIYIAGRFTSGFGDSIQIIGFPLLILDLYGSAKIMALATTVIMITEIMIRPFLGVIADNLNRKKLMINTDIVSGLLCLIMAFVAYKDMLSLPIIIIYLVIQSFVSTLFDSASYALMPELVEDKKLEKAYSYMTLINNISSISGPIIGTMLYSFLGIKILLLINGISFLISAVTEILIKYTYNKNGKTKNILKIKYIKNIKDGFVYMLKSKKIKYVVSVSMINSFFIIIPISQYFAFFFKENGFENYYVGIASSVMTAGSLIGATMIIFIKKNFNNKKSFVVSFIIFSISFILFGITLGINMQNELFKFIILSICLFINSFFMLSSNVIVNSAFQRSLPNEMRARIGSFRYLTMQIAMLLSVIVGGFLLDSKGSVVYILSFGFIYLFIILFFIFPRYKVLQS
ncbi:MFS transporter [Geotoga petraea]|uniref:Predicted arabinose efflux permease, MFS family n=1 Tax=Geotoga petraea TaxID=28234 RepID=A0A1G6NUN1_9BACT|nr:MFS transporter [Geotoga petraea]SDC70947.1 Predicted arabinose efflux permease, MFS family [Geotoga petraea]